MQSHSAGADDIAEGQLVEREVAGRAVLLCRAGGEVHALGANCTHHGAPLAEGALLGTRLVCPWHHAMFDVTTGARLSTPALDPIAHYPVEIRGDEVWVTFDEEAAAPASFTSGSDGRTFVVVGAGAAGEAAAEELRLAGFGGRVVLITAENALPYDRTELSKGYASGEIADDALPLRDAAFFDGRGIELLTGRRVARLDAKAKSITFENGERLGYDAALVAPGGVPRRLDVPEAEAAGVLALRSQADARAIVAAAGAGRRAVLIGSGFIGMELAASLRGRGLEVAVVTRDDEPFERALGAEVGRYFRQVHEANGVVFHRQATVATVEPGTVVLDDGTRVAGDVVVAGLGVTPATGFVEGVEKDSAGAIVVDSELRAAPGLWAAGDVALYPDARSGRRVRVEHWRLAQQHGRRAARNMSVPLDNGGQPSRSEGRGSAPAPFDEVPFFWSNQFDAGLAYVGNAADASAPVIEGSMEDGSFIAFYLDSGRVVAAAGVGRDQEMAALHARMEVGEEVEVPG